ncbi:hypothetical protein EVAR_61018_1 [Eumeta japonica]|uniref:Uncharacterized protein n=1 Tax=Eumeta variegata TaxID=151549 RepID=A0A4C1ZDD3_EUMVA|nr:hypothetical protein EVAR_61018_1 [Eumeta japonica]
MPLTARAGGVRRRYAADFKFGTPPFVMSQQRSRVYRERWLLTLLRIYSHGIDEIFTIFLRRCPNDETLSRHESLDYGAKRGITHAH